VADAVDIVAELGTAAFDLEEAVERLRSAVPALYRAASKASIERSFEQNRHSDAELLADFAEELITHRRWFAETAQLLRDWPGEK
jgi:hypothetical protein